MFNGIIKNTGIINRLYKKNNNCFLYILSKIKFTKKEIGSSISCSGACLTLEKYNRNLSKFYISKETLSKTIFKTSIKGDIINLEKPLKYGERISGHFVQGHVDGVETISTRTTSDTSESRIRISMDSIDPDAIVSKGSVTIEGVSLTIANVGENWFEVAIIPTTDALTTLGELKEGDQVNVETDIVARTIAHVVRRMK